MFWQVAAWLASSVLSYALSPKPAKPQQAAPTPAGLGEMDFPTAEAGRDIPVLFGTRWLKAPNVVWYGDLATEPIKESTCSGGKK